MPGTDGQAASPPASHDAITGRARHAEPDNLRLAADADSACVSHTESAICANSYLSVTGCLLRYVILWKVAGMGIPTPTAKELEPLPAMAVPS
jgi:hypothetical protein